MSQGHTKVAMYGELNGEHWADHTSCFAPFLPSFAFPFHSFFFFTMNTFESERKFEWNLIDFSSSGASHIHSKQEQSLTKPCSLCAQDVLTTFYFCPSLLSLLVLPHSSTASIVPCTLPPLHWSNNRVLVRANRGSYQ